MVKDVILELKRGSTTFKVQNPKTYKWAIGIWGTLAVKVKGTETRVFDTIERGGGFVILPPSSGGYKCKMHVAHSLRKIMEGRCLWPRGHNVRNKNGKLAGILIHSAVNPFSVVGCIGVGIKKNWGSMKDGEEVMKFIFEQMGGWKKGKSNCKLILKK